MKSETTSPATEYPECEKLKAVADESQKIGQFLDWLLGERNLELGQYNDNDRLIAQPLNIAKLLAEYFNIDMDKVEKERQEILSSIRE